MLYDDVIKTSAYVETKEYTKEMLLNCGVSKYLYEHKNTVLFKGEPISIIGNIWNSREKVAKALNTTVEELPSFFSKAIDLQPTPLKFVDNGYKKSDLNFDDLPIPKYYPGDGGRYVTSSIVSASLHGKDNLSYHRLMVLDKNKVAIRLVERHLYKMYMDSLKEGNELEVAIVIGAPLPFMIAAAISFEYEKSEINVANAINKLAYNKEMDFVKIHGLIVPADAAIVAIAKIKKDLVPEGPFCDIVNLYDPVRDQPVVEIEEIYLSNKPFFHAIVPGCEEHALLMGLPREIGMWKAIKSVLPNVKGVRLTESSGGWLHGVVSIKKTKEGDGKNAILAAFTGHPSMKRVIILDHDINIYDDNEIEWALSTRFQADKGLVIINSANGSSLDPSAHLTNGTTTKIGFDATLPIKESLILDDASKYSMFRKVTF
ncbi:MAG: UbiD family decarboxylase [Thermoplasmata archaeon]